MRLIVGASKGHVEAGVFVEHMVPADGRYVDPTRALLFAYAANRVIILSLGVVPSRITHEEIVF